MLVVITIIGILAALLIPAIYAAVTKAREAAITADINELRMAVDQYKNKHNDYPPNFLELYDTARTSASPDAAWSATILARHLKRINRQAKATLTLPGPTADPRHPLNVPDPKVSGGFLLKDPPSGPIISDPSASDTYIDPAETLVIWLGGLSAAAQYPLTGPGGPLDPSGAAFPHPTMRRDTALFEFKEDRLKDFDGDHRSGIGPALLRFQRRRQPLRRAAEVPDHLRRAG
jgi:type II secretory pathway pseudopilin PulG